ncbi:MAG TPA: signal peptidase I [Candidatus Limnocylindrales bacterium]|nr:signal peptidase I [Candidatus Limnocylindrales bacterium]
MEDLTEMGLPPPAPQQPVPPEEHAGPPPTVLGSPADYLESLLVTILIALFGMTFVVQAFKIPSQSMEPTLLVGDQLLVNKFIFGGNGAWYEKLLPYRPIRRGDVIVFKFPFDDHPHYVKRVIGVSGDHIRIVNQQVFVNGQLMREPYVIHDPSAEDPFGANFPPADESAAQIGLRPEWAARIMDFVHGGELVVPENQYFVMGDNRDHSWDSRYWGFVDRGAVMGRPVIIYWSLRIGSGEPASRGIAGTLRGVAEAIIHFPTRTRWRRMFHEVH